MFQFLFSDHWIFPLHRIAAKRIVLIGSIEYFRLPELYVDIFCSHIPTELLCELCAYSMFDTRSLSTRQTTFQNLFSRLASRAAL